MRHMLEILSILNVLVLINIYWKYGTIETAAFPQQKKLKKF